MSKVNPQDLLPHHRRELQLALQNIERTLSSPPPSSTKHHGSPSAAGSLLHPFETPVLSPPEVCLPANESQAQQYEADDVNVPTAGSSNVQITPSTQEGEDRSPPPLPAKLDGVSQFMKSLKCRSKKIRSFAEKNAEEAISRHSNWSEEDPRIVDIDISERRASPNEKFRGWLGRCSLAKDYLAWAESTYKLPRDEFLILDEKDADKRRQGHISEYVSLINLPKEKTHKAIRFGLKYISFEHLYGNTGVSAFLCHMFTAFRDLPYAQFNSLAKAIRESAEWSEMAKNKADWLSQCRLIYNEDSGRSNPVQRKPEAYLFKVHYRMQVRGRKRPLEVNWTAEQSQHKRKETANGASADRDVSSGNASSIPRPQVNPNSSRPANDCNDEEQQPPAGLNLCPDFDLWEDLTIFEGFDFWQEDLGFTENPLFSFAAEEEAGFTESVLSEPITAGLRVSAAFQEGGCGDASRESAGIPFNSPIFDTSSIPTVC